MQIDGKIQKPSYNLVGVGAYDDPPPLKHGLSANKLNSKNFKLYCSFYNVTVFAGEKPSQNSHSFACKQAKRDIFAPQKVGFLSPASPTLLGWRGLKNILKIKYKNKSPQPTKKHQMKI